MSSDADESMTQKERDPNILPNGAEIHFADDRDAHVPDRVEFLRGGFVKAIYKNTYQIDIHHPDEIESLHTYTEHLEDEEWW